MIEAMRSVYKLSRSDLAAKAGLSTGTIACIERGKRYPTENTVRKLEQAFGCTLYLDKHKEISVKVGNQEADIDEVIAPLIEQIWIAGIDTYMCCQQGYDGNVWIRFSSCDDLIAFLNIVMGLPTENRDDLLFYRINPRFWAEGPIPEWEYELNLTDLMAEDEPYTVKWTPLSRPKTPIS